MFKYNNELIGIILYYEGIYGNYYSIDKISYVNRIKYEEFETILKEFNGFEVWSRVVDGEIIKFNDEEDCGNCCEYLNSVLIMNKLTED